MSDEDIGAAAVEYLRENGFTDPREDQEQNFWLGHLVTFARAQVARLEAWVADLQSGMYVNCVYCGHRYGPGETTPVSMADALKAHVEQCPRHPMSALRAEVARLETSRANLLESNEIRGKSAERAEERADAAEAKLGELCDAIESEARDCGCSERILARVEALAKLDGAPQRPVPRGHCGRCDRCGWPLAQPGADGCYPGDCSTRPLPRQRETCAGCGAPFEPHTADGPPKETP